MARRDSDSGQEPFARMEPLEERVLLSGATYPSTMWRFDLRSWTIRSPAAVTGPRLSVTSPVSPTVSLPRPTSPRSGTGPQMNLVSYGVMVRGPRS